MVSFKLLNDPETITNLWPIIAPGLRKDLEHKTDGTTESKVFERLTAKKIMIVLFFVDDKYSGFVTFQKDWLRPGYVTMFNIFFDGSFTPETWTSFENFCKGLWKDGIKGMNFLADRKAFARRLEQVGYSQGWIELMKEL